MRPAHRNPLLLLLPLSCLRLSSGGKAAVLSTCQVCVEAGFGWSVKKSKCGPGFANRDCPAPADEANNAPQSVNQNPGVAAPAEARGFDKFVGKIPVTAAVPRMKWDSSDPHFIQTLSRRCAATP